MERDVSGPSREQHEARESKDLDATGSCVSHKSKVSKDLDITGPNMDLDIP